MSILHKIVAAAMPEANEAMTNYILWNRTAFPSEDITPKQLYKATNSYGRAVANNRRLCLFCDNEVIGDSTCGKCDEDITDAYS